MESFSDDQIFNADERGFDKEMSLGRMLKIKSTPEVHGAVQSKGAITHSYAIILVVLKTGKLMPKLMLVFREPSNISARVV